MKKKDKNATPEEPVTEQAMPRDETQEAAPQTPPEAEAAEREAIAAMLPAIDNLERAIDAAEKTEDGESGTAALAEGVKMTLNTLFDSLKRFGFEEIPALGEAFDPELHNAVMRETTDDPGKVLEVFQKGYRVKDKIIRYAMVKVSVE